MKNTLILTQNQTHFLEENRQDPITGDDFSIGDEIIFCASCKSAFLKESWEYMKGKHCNQYKKLDSFPPSLEQLALKKPKNEVVLNYTDAIFETRPPAIFLDGLLAILITILFFNISSFLPQLSTFFYYIGLAFFIFRDNLYGNQSIGKRMMQIYFIDKKTKQKALWYKVLFRNLIWWVFCGLCLVIFDIRTNTFLLLLIFNIIHLLYIIFKGESFIDRLLQIKLIEENNTKY
ncbi:hypothetical protein WAF17_03195 [Bernardetia sp. ABR2-2B]|uniref:RDD family protein n=1 Tax=Bernardetia sp. ABR2-2B TaxID=3127472 RepID=UPI0030CBB673